MKNFINFQIFILNILFFVCTCRAQNQLNVKTFGAKGDGIFDDTRAFQKCIDSAKRRGGVCFVPRGTFLINENLYLSSNSSLSGEGRESILVFKKGTVALEKNKLRNFYFTDNYINEIIPGNVINTFTSRLVKKNSKEIYVQSSKDFKPGDIIYTFNRVLDTWTFFEDQAKTVFFNEDKYPIARSEVFTIKSIIGNKLVFEEAVQYEIPKSSEVRLHVGSKNVNIKNLKIINKFSQYALTFEQSVNASIENIEIDSKGGILLAHKSIKNKISNCKINVSNGRAISIEYFSSYNKIKDNIIQYGGGGDAAVMVMMAGYNNVISSNLIRGKGSLPQNEIGIAIHTGSFGNAVSNNMIYETAEGIGSYYRSVENVFFENSISNVLVGYVEYFSKNNICRDNEMHINSRRNGLQRGAILFSSRNSSFIRNKISGNAINGFLIQSSNGNKVIGNNLETSSRDIVSKAILFVHSNYENVIKNNFFKGFNDNLKIDNRNTFINNQFQDLK